jgi:putative transposase
MRAYKFRIYPNKEQIKKIDYILDLSHNLYNAMLEQRKMAYELKKDFYYNINVNYTYQQNQLPELKNEFPEYKYIYSQVLQDVANRLDKAYDNFFRRINEKEKGKKIKAGFPRFKSKKVYKSFTYTQSGFEILDKTHLKLSKIGKIRMFKHREINGEIKGLTIKRENTGKYYAIFTVNENNNINYSLIPDKPIGFDLGLLSLIKTSNDEDIEPPKYLRKSEKKLKKLHRSLSRKNKGSKNREEARIQLAGMDNHISNQRNDFAQKLSNKLIKEYNFIAFEDLNINNMVKNHKLAKSIEDASWGSLIKDIIYKAESAGKSYLKVNPKYTSMKCSKCGNIKNDLTLDDRTYHCDVCGITIDRDLNAAINILNDAIDKIFKMFIIKHKKKSRHGLSPILCP